MPARPTIKDLSEFTQLSSFTVSQALNGREGVAPETRDRVLAAAAELGYVPNLVAKSLRKNASRTVAVLTANIHNPFYATLIASLSRAIQPAGYQCLVADAVSDGRYDESRESVFVADSLAHRMAAVVLTFPINDANMDALTAWGVPVLFVDCLAPPHVLDLPSVTTDNYLGSQRMAEHLLSHHRYNRKWALIGFTGTWTTREPRQRGFTDIARQHGVEVDIIEGGNDPEHARNAVSTYLDSNPDSASSRPQVIYATNTPLLHGTLTALADRGLRVPHDVAVVAFDEFDWASVLQPSITVIDQHIDQVGALAGQRVIELIDDPSSTGTPPPLRPDLVIRQSCGC